MITTIETGGDKARYFESFQTDNFIWADPVTLLEANPALNIVNTPSYRLMEANFSPDQFDPPKAVWVEYSLGGRKVVRLCLTDGHTRTKYALDHPEVMVQHFGSERILLRDTTASTLLNPLIVPENERAPEQKALTMAQYLRAVILPTMAHSDIASDRIATHLINGWQSMTGEELASKFSAIAALSLLEQLPIANDQLRKFLANQSKIMEGETREERYLLERSLREMAFVIREARLDKKQVTEAAFALVVSNSEVIGGQKEAFHQVYGLLHTPIVENKLSAEPKDTEGRERMRLELGKVIVETFNRFSGVPNKEEIVKELVAALKDPMLKLADVVEVYNSLNPIEKYRAVRQEINFEKLKGQYLEGRETELSGIEEVLINNLGRKTHLDEQEITRGIRAIGNAQVACQQAGQFIDRLSNQEEELIKQGVHKNTIDEEISSLLNKISDIKESNSPQTINLKTGDLQQSLSLAWQKVEREKAVSNIKTLVASNFSEEISGALVVYIMGAVGNISNEVAVTNLVNRLKSLDSDLRTQVLLEQKRLAGALREQEQRALPAPEPTTIPEARTMPKTDPAPIQAVTKDLSTESVVITPALTLAEQISSAQRTHEQRIQRVNQGIIDETAIFLKKLEDPNFDPHEMDMPTRKALESLLNFLGLVVVNHPDVAGLARESKKTQ